MLTLAAERREGADVDARDERAAGFLPAVVYGAKTPSAAIRVKQLEFEKVLAKAGEMTVVTLTGLGKDVETLIHDVDLDPITNRPRHADFYALVKGQKVEVDIPVVFVGESPAVKAGANVVKVAHELPVRAEAARLPHDFSIDLSVLAKVGDAVHVRDLAIPEGVEVLASPDDVVVLVQEITAAEEEPVAAIDMEAIEVEKKGKETEGETSEGAPTRASE